MMCCRFSTFRRVFSARKMVFSTTADAEVILEKLGNVGLITLNRPKALNALNLSMIKCIFPKLKDWEKETSHVIIKGAGEKAFCAGGDVRAVTEAGKRNDPMATNFFSAEYQLNHLIGTLKIPYIALIHGITMGGGVGLSVHGKFRVATEKSIFAMPETAIGMVPDVGGSFFLPRLAGNLGTFLGLTGYRLIGSDLMHAGITTHFCQSTMLKNLEEELCQTNDTSKLSDILDKYTKEGLQGTTPFVLEPHLDKINRCFDSNTVEEILLNLRNDGSPWTQDQAAKMLKMSPMAMKVSLQLLREGKRKSSLKSCLEMEFRVVSQILKNPDFYEGVRAVLVDRDNKPNWNPSKLEDVKNEKVDSFFTSLPSTEELNLI